MEIAALENGIIVLPSRYSVDETLDRLENLLKANEIRVFARIDQKAVAQEVGLTLRQTQLLIFGDPKAGTPLMDKYPSLALDLPLKVLAWEDAGGSVWLNYNSPIYLQNRHGLLETPFVALGALLAKAVG